MCNGTRLRFGYEHQTRLALAGSSCMLDHLGGQQGRIKPMVQKKSTLDQQRELPLHPRNAKT